MVSIRVLAFEQSDQDVQLATELYLNKHTSFESFIKDLEKQPFMSKYNKSDESYYVMAKALGNICYLSQSQDISIEDFDSSLISFEEFTISNEGVSSTVVNKSLDLVNVSKPVYNKLDIMGQIKVHMRSIKKAFEKKDWKLVSSIRDLLTSLWNKAKAAGIAIKDSVKSMFDSITRKIGKGTGKSVKEPSSLKGQPYDPKNLSRNDRIHYDRTKSVIYQATKKKDWDYLVGQFNTRTQDFPDIIENIRKTLKANGVKYGKVNGRWELLK